MKKVISIILVAVLAAAMVTLVACGNKDKATDGNVADAVKLGMGVVANLSDAKDADGDTNGSGGFVVTAAAVLLDAEGKIAAIDLDSADISLGWTSEGKLIAAEDLRTKYEKGTDYNMAAYGKKHDGSDGQVSEWYAQADAFMATAKGKTVEELKAFMGEDTYATGDLATAGCTIKVDGFIAAVEKAVANAVDADVAAEDRLSLAMVSSAASSKDASEDAEGAVIIDTTIVAAVTDAEGKVVAAKTDAVQGKTAFDVNGKATVDTTAEVKTKRELGDSYNMAAYGKKHDGSDGQVLEWYAQADAFDAALIGKTADEFAAFAAEDGYATGDLATAGCTIGISDMIKAAAAAATVA